MKPTSHSSNNMILGAGDIPNTVDIGATMLIEDNVVMIHTFWVPDTVELKALNEGGGVMVRIMSTQVPPMYVGVVPVDGFKTS